MGNGKNAGYLRVPEDYAIDALALEAQLRGRARGRLYSYGELVADTTREEREKIAESYRAKLAAAIRRGRHRVSAGSGRLVTLQGDEDTAEQVRRQRRKLKGMAAPEGE